MLNLACREDALYGEPNSSYVHKGTLVRYEVFEEGYAGLLSISYRDSLGNNRIEALPSGWIYSYSTITDNQPIQVSATSSASVNSVTVRIFINEKVQRENTSTSAVVSFP